MAYSARAVGRKDHRELPMSETNWEDRYEMLSNLEQWEEGASCARLGSGGRATAKPGVFAQDFVSIGFPFVTAIRAFHCP